MKIALFFTGPKHAGENIAQVLKQRAGELPSPIQMCDALSRNTPKLAGIKILLAHCLAHGRRQVVEQVETFPRNADTCWRHWAAFTTMMRWRANGSCRRNSG